MMNKIVIYIHGQGGNPDESGHYKIMFPDYEIVGLNYMSQTPWDAKKEFAELYDDICKDKKEVIIIANSIGAYFALNSLNDKAVSKAYFISPVVDMKKIIEDLMLQFGVTEEELHIRGSIKTSLGQELSWKYYCYVRNNPIIWRIPTHILYGSADNMISETAIREFADSINGTLTVMENGEHWFHTDEQMEFLDNWINYYQKQ